jgi:pyruvate dehydrogenase E2 component (dihydrolipoyllysine-residue acetyltransferase)
VPFEIAMPRLSDQMEEATVIKWLKQPGDQVTRGEPLVEVETDKATMVYEAEFDGVLDEIVVDEGSTAALGATIARASGTGPSPSPQPAPAPALAAAVTSEGDSQSGTAHTTAVGAGNGSKAGRSRATPVARRLAAELGVELAGVEGTGPGGRIVRADVRDASAAAPEAAPAAAEATRAAAPEAAPAAAEATPAAAPEATPAAAPVGANEVELTPTQRTIAQRMTESRAQIPEFTLEAEIDMEALAELRDELRDLGREPLPSFNDLVVKAAAISLRKHPAVNSSWADGRIRLSERVNVGIAVATDDALYVPTLFDADTLSVFEIAAQARAQIGKVMNGSIAPDELRDGTFTVSNLGMFGVRRFQAVINPPQAAILAVGEVARRPAVDAAGAIVARHQMDVVLSCDHRVVYGAEAARFLQSLKNLLERPVALVAA